MIVPVPRNFAFQPTVESHGWFRLAPFRWSREKGVLRRREAGGEIAISCRNGALHVKVEDRHSCLSGQAGVPVLHQQIARMFQLDVDIAEFVELTRDSPAHAWVAQTGFGRLLCGATLWEDAVKIITTTNTMWRQTVRMVELLVAKAGGVFPTQEQIAGFTVDELQNDCRLGYRAKSIHALASRDLTTLPESTADRYKFYLSLPGIGPYGAAHLLAMDGRHDFIAVDTEFRRFVRERYHGGRKVSDETMLRRYRKWGRRRHRRQPSRSSERARGCDWCPTPRLRGSCHRSDAEPAGPARRARRAARSRES
ncbi:MAG TPA: endonuclease III domain-containing protein [Thermoanaerobaculia bacterium]|nr:endonuclease III domain-containing protein [Thermoanaerobaculia bacterium]